MSRRVVGLIAVVIALIAGGLLWSRGTHPANAVQAADAKAASAAAQPAATSQPVQAVTEHEASGAAGSATAPDPARGAENENAAAPASAAQDGVGEVDSRKAFGSKSAPIVMEVFSDYQCPACRAFYEGTNRQLMENYVSTGKVYLIHRDFPLQMHAYSRVAARYARAAAAIGKIEPAEKALFDNQDRWEQNGDVDGTLAAALSSAEMTRIRALVKGGTLEPLIDKDYQLGMGYRISETPTTVFHCKGQTYPYAGGMNYEMLHTFLDQLLSQK
ncbi:MAG TPA: thioredoxin domain-containing protein [Candidatus Acidoferrum sp.]|nr:thioredoxin domain-containing protein [Candidatus Acidoferrum sp.]